MPSFRRRGLVFIMPKCLSVQFFPFLFSVSVHRTKAVIPVEVPDLPGYVSAGDSLADAILMATDAVSGWVLDELEDGKDVPKVNPIENILSELGDFVNILILDMDAYAEKYGEKAVRNNLTIPAWLNIFAEKNYINF